MTDGSDDLYALPDLYDAQYRSYREDLAFYRRIVDDHGGPVLEVGCGTGRITVELARTGTPVTGIDASEAMLEQARRRVREAGVAAAVALRQGDMRELAGADEPGGPFRVAIAPFNTLMHAYTLEDQDSTLAGMFAALEPGGVFACDAYVPRFGSMGVVRAEPMWQRALGPDTDLFLVQDHDATGQRIVSTYFVDRIDAEGRVHRQRVRLTQRYFTPFELERAVRAAGFERVRMLGSFERAPLRDDSDVIVVVARKPGP